MQLCIRFFILFFLFPFFLHPNSINVNGVTGLFSIPTARMSEDGSLSASFLRSYPDRKLFLVASPFEWLEASVFYTSIENKPYIAYKSDYIFENQSYKDKGFNFKLKILPETNFFPQVALGLNDLGGTGLFSSEYVAASKKIKNIDFTFGIGFGNYSGGYLVSNPIAKVFPSYLERSGQTSGEFNFSSFFRGSKSSLFFGMLYESNYMDYFVEIDPIDYENMEVDYLLNGRENKINFGIIKKWKKFNLKYTYARNRDSVFQLTYKTNIKAPNTNPTFIQRKNESIQKILSLNQIGLKKILEGDNNFIQAEVRQNSYQNSDIADKRAINFLTNEFGNEKEIVVSQYYLGMKMSSVTKGKYSNRIEDLSNQSNKVDYKTIYNINDNFPYFNYDISIKPKTFLAGREGFFHGGLGFEFNNEIIFRENLLITANLKYPIFSNFEKLKIPPVNTYPNQVRSDNKKYYNAYDEGLTIGRLQIDYFLNKKSNYFALSAGIFEDMFSGVGFQYVNSKKNRRFAWGIDSFYVKKRNYRMLLDHLKYSNIYVRGLSELRVTNDIYLNISYGEYLAGDKGYTLSTSKRYRNGAKFGFFFTRTNVSKELYGEGSFDKGIFISLPIQSIISSSSSSRTNIFDFTWRPLTKDPGALLVKNIDLIQEIQNFRQ